MFVRLPRFFNIEKWLSLQRLLIGGAIITALAVVASYLRHAPLLWQVGFGTFAIVAFLRYPYFLLIIWVLLNPWIGSPISYFNGNHFLTDLIVPTLLLLPFLPLKQTARRFPALIPLVVLLLWMFVSITFAPISRGTFLNYWLSYIQYAALVMLVINVLTTRRRLSGLIDAMLLLSVLVVCYGIYDYITRQHVQYDPFTFVPRIMAIFGSAPAVAMLLSVSIPLAVYRVFTVRGFWRIVALAGCLLLPVGVWLSYTRTTYISIPLGLVVLLFALPTRRMRVYALGSCLVFALVVVLLATVGHIPIFNRFFSQDVLTFNGRIYLWQALLAHFDPTRILGGGLRASDVLLQRLQVRDQYGVIGTVSHNVFLEVLYDHGIIGLLLLLSTFILLLISLVRGIYRSTGEQRLLCATALAIFISMMIQCLQSNDLLTDLTIGSYFWIAMALPFASSWMARTVADQDVVPDTGTTGAQANEQVEQNTSDEDEATAEERVRVCLVSLAFPPIVGGGEIQAERQAQQLKATRQEVMVVTLRHRRDWSGAEIVQGIPIIRIGGFYRRDGRLRIGRVGHIPIDILLFIKLWRLRHHYDVLHAFQAHFPAAVATLVGRLTGKPVIVRIQNCGPDDAQRAKIAQGAALLCGTLPEAAADRLRVSFVSWAAGEGDIDYLPYAGIGGRAAVRFLRRSNAFYHVLSTRCRTYLISRGFRADHIVHIPNGIDSEEYEPASEPEPEATERRIMCVARLEYAKGIDVLLHAWRRLLDEQDTWGPDLKPTLWLVGDGALREQLEWIAAQLDIQESVQFCGTRQGVSKLLHQSWGFVLPSRWEGMPNALLEAMACGLPCIATRVSGSEDIVIDGVNGLLVEAEQPAELAAALQRVITDSELAQRLRQEARASILEKYQLASQIELSIGLYRRLLAETTSAVGGQS